MGRDEGGYSLTEVPVAVMIRSAAIIPVVGMLDMGLNSATKSVRYDEARVPAHTRLEEARTLPFGAVFSGSSEVVGWRER